MGNCQSDLDMTWCDHFCCLVLSHVITQALRLFQLLYVALPMLLQQYRDEPWKVSETNCYRAWLCPSRKNSHPSSESQIDDVALRSTLTRFEPGSPYYAERVKLPWYCLKLQKPKQKPLELELMIHTFWVTAIWATVTSGCGKRFISKSFQSWRGPRSPLFEQLTMLLV